MKKLVLLRHGESTWNQENRFTGWTNVGLTPKGEEEAKKGAKYLKDQGITFKKAYTSYLSRAIKTLNIALDTMDLEWIPVEKSWRLNEKHYGMLQGLNKSETAEKYGEAKVLTRRRSYDAPPAPLEKDDPRSPFQDPRYAEVAPDELPLTESLKDCVARISPYWEEEILPNLEQKGEILVVAHGNSLRAIIKVIKGISDADIVNLNLPTGVPYIFEFDDRMQLTKDYFL